MDPGFDPATAGISGLSNVSSFGLFINPATGGRFNVSFERRQPVRAVFVAVSNATGQVLYRNGYPDTGSSFFREIDISALPKGVYFLRLEADGEVLTRRIVIA